MVNKAKLVEKIAQLHRDKKVVGITDLRDESDQEGMRIIIELRKDANVNVILNQLYKHTQLQDTFGVIMLALVNGEPKILNLLELLTEYLNHQKEVVTRRSKFELDKAEQRAHIIEGLLIALDNIDEVIKIIRGSYDDPKEKLMKRFNLTDIQAQAILDMRLRTLSGLQREKIEEEYNELMALIAHLRDILNSETLVFGVIKEELLKIKDKYGDERKTKIKAAEGEIEIEDLIKEEQTVVTLTHFGYIKRLPIDTYKSQRRGGKGITALTKREEDVVKQIFTTSTHDTILFFSNKGKLYRLRGYEIPEAGRTAKGTAIVNLLSLDAGEKISAVIPIQNFAEGKYLLFATRNGIIKKTPLMEYNSARKTGLLAITLKDEDELIDVRLTDGEDNIVLVTRQGLAITFNEKDVRPMGRTSQGVIGIRLNKDDLVIGMECIFEGSKATLLAITENGFGKRTELDEYRVQIRGGKGVITYKITPKTGNIVGIRIVTESDDVMLITDTGTIIRINAKDISVLGRSTQGVTLMRTNEGKVVSIEKIPEEDEEE
jgi:DNA gyrase subunit A